MAVIEGIESVFFDAAGTLFDVRGSVGHIYAEIAVRHGVRAERAEINREFAAAFRERSLQGITADGADTALAEKQWWFDVVRAVFETRMSEEVLRGYFHEVFEAFRRGDAWALFADVRPALERLRAAGFRLGIISNFDSRLLQVLHELEIDTLFETVTLSWRAGAAKPDPRIFQAALGSMHATAGAALHVGDSPGDDFDGARNAGLRAVLLDRSGHVAGSNHRMRARDLHEVCRLLGI